MRTTTLQFSECSTIDRLEIDERLCESITCVWTPFLEMVMPLLREGHYFFILLTMEN